MATYFGEVVINSSRAIDDDDDCVESNCVTDVSEETSDYKSAADIMIVCDGTLSTDFVEAIIRGSSYKKVNSINVTEKLLLTNDGMSYSGLHYDNKKITKIDCIEVFLNGTAVLFVSKPNDIPQESCYKISELIFKFFCKKMPNVIILTAEHVSKYKSSRQTTIQVPFLRSLSSCQNISTDQLPPFLEQPNVITGLSAAVLSHCKRNRLEGTLFVLYTDVLITDSINLQAMMLILKFSPLFKVFKDVDVKFSTEDKTNSTNLYI